ncbi:MAG: DUF2164 domain-containing protein [bacterium]|nr:DUF2164 domain-containing protein [bacterium]
MSVIELDKASKEKLIHKLQQYFQRELHQELGGFDAEFLLDFFAEHAGVLYYNQAVTDVQAFVQKQAEEIGYSIGELEKPLPR